MPEIDVVRSLLRRASESRERLTKFDEVWRDLTVDQHNAFLESQALAAKLEKNAEEWVNHWKAFRTRDVVDKRSIIQDRGQRLSEIIELLEGSK